MRACYLDESDHNKICSLYKEILQDGLNLSAAQDLLQEVLTLKFIATILTNDTMRLAGRPFSKDNGPQR